MGPRLPPSVEKRVVECLYTEALELDWSHLPPQKKSAQYNRWVEDPQIGGRLLEYMTPTAARVWIKDGPMKEWSRATSGIGKYAALVSGSGPVPLKLALKVLGEAWEAIPESLEVKPLRVVARTGEDEVVLTWAPVSGLKHMFWAALVASAEGDVRDWIVCVTDTFNNPTPANEKQSHLRLAKRCGLKLVHVSL